MILLFSFLFFIGLLILGIRLYSSYDYDWVGTLLIIISGVFLLVGLIAYPANYIAAKEDIAQYYAVKQTVDNARTNKMDSLEKATLINQIIDTNKKIASYKFWRKTIMKDIFPKELDNLQYLK